MKKLISLVILFSGFQAQADFINWKVGPVQGTLQTLGDLVLEEAQAVLYCQYCNIGTCAGGPSKQTDLETRLTSVADGQYQLLVEGGRHVSGYPLKNLSGCGYYLTLKGHDRQSGMAVSGEIPLASSRRQDANPVWEDEQLADALTDGLTKSPLKLEIQTRGHADPEIYPVENN